MAAGRLLEKEVEVLLGARNDPRRPFIAILGGSKVSDKLGVINALLDVCDGLIIGGGMCFTFLKAQGHSIGASLCEDDQVDTCKELLASGATIHLPHDITGLGPGGKIGDPSAGGEVRQFGKDLPDGWMASKWLWCIFQLPEMSGVRVDLAMVTPGRWTESGHACPVMRLR